MIVPGDRYEARLLVTSIDLSNIAFRYSRSLLIIASKQPMARAAFVSLQGLAACENSTMLFEPFLYKSAVPLTHRFTYVLEQQPHTVIPKTRLLLCQKKRLLHEQVIRYS